MTYSIKTGFKLVQPITYPGGSPVVGSPIGGSPIGGSYQKLVLAQSPQNYWRLGESSGTTVVDEIGNNNGTYINSPTQGTDGLIIDSNTAVSFNGSTQRVDIIGFSKPSGEDITVACWFKSPNTPDTSSYQHIVGGSDAFGIYFNHPGVAGGSPFSAVIVRNTSVAVWASFGTYTPDTTVFLVFTYDGSSLKTYNNGSLITTTNSAGTINAESAFKFMRHYSLTATSNHVEGTLDEVTILDRALSVEEITALYDKGKNG